jgi:hypothetical protein
MHLEYLEGSTHGDLHLDNVIIPWPDDSAPNIEHLRFIDLSAFNDSAPLTRDIATLILSCVSRSMRSGLDADKHESLISLLTDHDGKSANCLPEPLVDTVMKISQAADFLPNHWKRKWHAQYLLSLQAQSLIYTSYDNVGEHSRRWFFRLAAHAAESFLDLSE